MTHDAAIWSVIVGMAVVNYAMRATPIAAMARMRLGGVIERWLSFVPVSVMAALVVGEVLRPGGAWLPPLHNPYLLAALPTGVIYYMTRSLIGSTLAGIVVFVAARALLG
jgi:branched-subunit amino acid transport protein